MYISLASLFDHCTQGGTRDGGDTFHHWLHLLRETPIPVIIWTDHHNLTYWCKPHKVGPCTATWQIELQQYNYELYHKPGDSMKADTLSHCPDFDTRNSSNEHLIVLPLNHFIGMPQSILQALSIPSTISLNVLGIEDKGFDANHLEAKVKLYQDDHYLKITPLIESHNLRINSNNYLWKDSALIVIENNDLRRGVLHHFHSSLTTGHPGIAKTIQLISPFYWWPHMKDFVTNFVKGCTTCQMNKINTYPTRPPLFPITSTSSLPFQTVAMDFITKLPSSYGHNTILTITDHDVSKASIFLPCKEIIDTVCQGYSVPFSIGVVMSGTPAQVLPKREGAS